MTPNIQIGAAIRAARKAKGWSQTELGEKINKSVQAVSAYEAGLNDIPFSIMKRLACVLKLNLNKIGGECGKFIKPRK
jgi:transcriptional regulator with XRE-family HTH domain